MRLLCKVRRAAFGISLDEVKVARRGFRCPDPRIAERLERIGTEFLAGYRAALEESSCAALASRLNATVAHDFRGFAFEGAGMALSLLDGTHFTRGAFDRFLGGPAEPHTYMLHVGAGWAFARLPWIRRRPEKALRRLDPLLRWLALDGFGFHEGYFHWPESVRLQRAPTGMQGYRLRAFDQGLGRSLWFVEGMDPDRIAASVTAFPEARRSDLWSGVGLACCYAGGADYTSVCRLRKLAGVYAGALAQGAAFASEARRRAGNPTSENDETCRAICGRHASEAAAAAREEMRDLPPDGILPAYEIWRTRIRERMAKSEAML